MQFSSLNLYREASFFSRKSMIEQINFPIFTCLAAQIIKNAINPPKKIANSYSLFYMENYPQFKGTGTGRIFVTTGIYNFFRHENN